ncbi:MAG: hypothetical protein F4039_05670 [Gammaproteobacteria bacterium]|nr:hypothetical protein [Gammaproteobacteria bacterium]MYK43556.1 hypothetical protein [Gammaproteobacteria bacterium]
MKPARFPGWFGVVLFCMVLVSCGNDGADRAELDSKITEVPAKIYCNAKTVIDSMKFHASVALETQSNRVVVRSGIEFQFVLPANKTIKWGCYAEGFLDDGRLIRVSLLMPPAELQEFVSGYIECGFQPVPATIQIIDVNDNRLYDKYIDELRVIAFSFPSCPDTQN